LHLDIKAYTALESRFANLMDKTKQTLAEHRLTTPVDNNAVDYALFTLASEHPNIAQWSKIVAIYLELIP